MGFLIGGLSPKQYDAYLSTTSRTQVEKPRGIMAFLGISSGCAALAVFINRLAYFIFNCTYPNDTYLFNKFKSHQFAEIKSTDEYQAAREIFKRFQKCSELEKADVAKVKKDLKDVKHQLYPNVANQPLEPVIGEPVIGENNQENSDIEDEGEDVKLKKNEEEIEKSDSDASVKGNEDQDINNEEEVKEITHEEENNEKDLSKDGDVPVGDSALNPVDAEADAGKVDGNPEEELKKEWEKDELEKAAENLAQLDQKPQEPSVDNAADDESEEKINSDNKKDSAGANVETGVEEEEHKEPVEEKAKVVEGADVEKEEELKVEEEELEVEKEEVKAEQPQVEETLSPHIEAVKLYMQEEVTAEQLLEATKGLQTQLSNSSISTTFDKCQAAKNAHEKAETEKNKAAWSGMWGALINHSPQRLKNFVNPISAFNYNSYAVAHEKLDVLLEVATNLLKFSVKARLLSLNGKQRQEFNDSFAVVQEELIKFRDWLSLVDTKVKEVHYANKKQELNDFIQVFKEESALVIGVDAQGDKTYPQWEISYYENLVVEMQKHILDYLTAQGFNIQILALQSLEPQTNAWFTQLQAILLTCRQAIRSDQKRFNDQYIQALTNTCLACTEELHKAAEWAEGHPEAAGVQHIHAICYQLYAMLDMSKDYQKIVETFVDAAKPSSAIPAKYQFAGSQYDLIRSLYATHKRIQESSKIKSLVPDTSSGSSWLGWGGKSKDSDVKSIFMSCILERTMGVGEKLRQVKELGMEAPITYDKSRLTSISAEFRGFLDYCKTHKLKHLYVHMLPALEKDYYSQIQHLEKEFKDTFFTLKFSQDSLFYQQKGHQIDTNNIAAVRERLLDDLTKDGVYIDLSSRSAKKIEALKLLINPILEKLHREELAQGDSERDRFNNELERESFIQRFHDRVREKLSDPAKTKAIGQFKLNYSVYDSSDFFKEALVAQMFDGSPDQTGNYISPELVDKFDLRTWAADMAEQIHQKMFENKNQLSAEERRIFIRLFNHHLMQKVLLVTEVDSYNMSCEKGFDQGVEGQAEEFAYLAILNNNTNNPEVIKTFETNLFARAVIVNKSSIDEGCLERTIETVKFMLEHQDGLKALHTEMFPELPIPTDQLLAVEEEELE